MRRHPLTLPLLIAAVVLPLGLFFVPLQHYPEFPEDDHVRLPRLLAFGYPLLYVAVWVLSIVLMIIYLRRQPGSKTAVVTLLAGVAWVAVTLLTPDYAIRVYKSTPEWQFYDIHDWAELSWGAGFLFAAGASLLLAGALELVHRPPTIADAAR